MDEELLYVYDGKSLFMPIRQDLAPPGAYPEQVPGAGWLAGAAAGVRQGISLEG